MQPDPSSRGCIPTLETSGSQEKARANPRTSKTDSTSGFPSKSLFQNWALRRDTCTALKTWDPCHSPPSFSFRQTDRQTDMLGVWLQKNKCSDCPNPQGEKPETLLPYQLHQALPNSSSAFHYSSCKMSTFSPERQVNRAKVRCPRFPVCLYKHSSCPPSPQLLRHSGPIVECVLDL